MSDSKVKISNILESQLPEFILDDNPLFKEFLEQYYLSQQHEYGTIDLAEKIDELKNIDSFVKLRFAANPPKLTKFISNDQDLIEVTNHAGFLAKDGLVKIGTEIFTYKGKTSFVQKVTKFEPSDNTITLASVDGLESFRAQSIIFDTSFSSVVAGTTYFVTEVNTTNKTITISDDVNALDDVFNITDTNALGTTLPIATNFAFTGCIRGFSGIDTVSNSEFLNFNLSQSQFHEEGDTLTNLSFVFLAEFFKKYKKIFLPGIEDRQFQSVNIDNILSRARDFYSSKGTDSSLKILFAVLFGTTIEVRKPFDNTIQSSGADFSLSDVIVVETISGDPGKLDETTILQGSVDNPTAKGIVSRTESILLNGKYYHKIFFPRGSIENSFKVSKVTKVLGIGITDTTLTVDSTIGFPESGSFVNPDNDGLTEVTYTSKSANQFYGCVGLSKTLVENSPITDGNYIFGYEDNDVNKLVTMRAVGTIVGVADDKTGSSQFRKGDLLRVKHLGEKIEESDLRFNRWFYNNVVITDVEKVLGTTNLRTSVDHHLYPGDKIDILLKNDKSVVDADCTINEVFNRREFSVSNATAFDTTKFYLIRKKLDFADKDLNKNDILANIQNTFVDKEKNTYIAFSGLPGYDSIETTDRSKQFTSANININTNQLTVVGHNYENGEQVYYQGSSSILEGNYFVIVIDVNTIQLAFSRTSADKKVVVDITNAGSGSHKLIPSDLFGKSLVNLNSFKRIRKNPKQASEHKEIVGAIGVALNGIEFHSPVSTDSIFYGQIDKVNVLNAGTGFNIIDPPSIGIADTAGSSGASFVGHYSGAIQDVIIDAPGFDYKDTPAVTITGGNGTQAIAEARLRGFTYEVSFIDSARGNQNSDTIDLPGNRFLEGEEITYLATGNPIGIGSTNVGFNTSRLTSGATYFIAKVTDSELSLASTKARALAKVDLIDMNAFGDGTHTFRSRKIRKIIDSINILSSTDDFANKKVIVDGVSWPPADQKDIYKSFVGVNTENDYIYARNHTFKTGDNIRYSFDGTTIAGLTTTANYKVTVLDEDRFLLSEAGTATTISSVNFDKKNYVNLTSVGVGTHTFEYPPISLSINGPISVGDTTTTPAYYLADAHPIIRGSLDNVFIRNGGVGYGVSDVINYRKDVGIEIQTGQEAEIKLIILGGVITSAYIAKPGFNYTSPPEINVIGNGRLAKLTVTIVDGSIATVSVVNGGTGYDNTSRVEIVPTGSGGKLDVEVHEWKFNNVKRYEEALQASAPRKDRLNRELVQINSGAPLKQSQLVAFYPGAFYRGILKDNVQPGSLAELVTGFAHSPIIGWAYDGNPIYGPYGHTNALFDGVATGGDQKMQSSYEVDEETSSLLRPNLQDFPKETFTQDFVYKASGDLDEYNGRFCKTPEFPNGTYAYFSTIDFSGNLTYPYITKSHYNETDDFNYQSAITQKDSILNSGDYKRNVTHLGLNDQFRDYPFFDNALQSGAQVNVDVIKAGRIDDVNINDSGVDYKVGEQINFNEPSIDVEIEEVIGKNIESITTNQIVLENTIFSVDGNVVTGVTTIPHTFVDGDTVEITGIGSATYKNIEGFRNVGVATVLSNTTVALAATTTTGITTSITLQASTFSEKFLKDDIIQIGNEVMKIVGVDTVNNTYKVVRIFNDSPGSTHGLGAQVLRLPQEFTFILDKKLENKNIAPAFSQNFDSRAVGIGSTYTSVVVGFAGSSSIEVSIPERAIFLPGHKFKTGDPVNLVSVGGTVMGSALANLTNRFDVSTISPLFAVNIATDFIGIATSKEFVGINSTLFFEGNTEGINHTLTQIKDNLIGTVVKTAAVAVASTSHDLKVDDEVRFHITPNEVQQFELKFNPTLKKLVVDPKTFAPAGITTVTTSNIAVTDHGLKTGDIVAYTQSAGIGATPLQHNREYHVIKIDDNTFRLAETNIDALAFPFQNIVITDQGFGTHEVAKINPKLEIINGGRFALNTGDTSLDGFDIKFYYDKTFQARFESTLIKRDGVIGDGGANTQIITTINKDLPSSFYYRVEGDDTKLTDSYPSAVNESVDNHSNICVVDSKFNQNYKLTSVGTTSFNFTLVGAAETTSYTPAGFETGFYSTSSTTAIGGIHSLKTVNAGINVKIFPAITSIGSSTGVSANLQPVANDVGEVVDGVVIRPGAEFSEDKTIKPKADSSLVLKLKNIRSLKAVGVVTTGNDYNVPPTVVAVGNNTIVTQAELEGGSVGSVRVITTDSNLDEGLKVIATNNSNGVGIVNAVSSNQINEIMLRAPQSGSGFAVFPFEVGEQIFVENVQITNGNAADGYNSSDYNFAFFTITARNTASGTESVSYSIAGLGITGGTYDISQNAQFGRVIKVSDLATFEPEFAAIKYTEGERVVDVTDSNVFGFVAKNGWDEESGILRLNRVNGEFTEDSVVRGVVSSSKATISEVSEFDFDLNVGSTSEDAGIWRNDVGKLSDTLQRLHDNDYYQRFSYSIAGDVQLSKWKETVDSLDHTAGYKNFSDLQIVTEAAEKKTVKLGIGETNLNVDMNSIRSVHSRLSYDLASEDTDAPNLSKLITFDSKVITDYNESRTNKVLMLDDISSQFTGVGNSAGQLVGLSTFTILNEGKSILHHAIDVDTAIDISNDVITITDHNFNTGEELKYDKTNAGINTGDPLVIQEMNVPGIGATDRLPDTVYAIRTGDNTFKVAVTQAGTAVTFTQVVGLGITQSFSVEETLATTRSIITIDNIIQSPIAQKPVGVAITMFEAVGVGSTQIRVSTFEKIQGKSLLRFPTGEIVKVDQVGVGATNVLNVTRGAMGTVPAEHIVGTACSVVTGDYRIKQGKIYFSDPPYGPAGIAGITTRSSFTGRVFYKLNYASNVIFDDISNSFDGSTDRFAIISAGAAVTGITTAAGAVLINNIFQKPFLSPVGSILVSDYRILPTLTGEDLDFTGDVLRKDLPRGGIINEFAVGVGSGYQVPTRAIGAAVVNGSGVITGVTVGVGSTGIRSGGAGHIFPPRVSVAATIGGTGAGASITANVSVAGTVTGFNVLEGGTGYSQTAPPLVFTDEPAPYKNLPLSGGVGAGASMDVVVGTGGSIIDFKMSSRGIGYEEGDVLTLTGLPGTPVVNFTVTVVNKYQDKFSGWAFGQLIELDDFSNQFNDVKTQFLITRTEINREFYSIVAEQGSGIILQNNLLIFLNDVLQRPGDDYEFTGGTRLKFKEAPKRGSKFKMYFYTGSDEDYLEVDVDQTIKPGDQLRLQYRDPVVSQERRTIYELIAADTVETETYTGPGIRTDNTIKQPDGTLSNLRPIEWTKQTTDLIIDGRKISKTRNSLEPQYFPSTNLIQPVAPADTTIFIESAWPFTKIDDLAQTKNDVRIVGFGTTTVVEVIKSVTYAGDYGRILDVTTNATGISTTSPRIIFDMIPDPSIYTNSGQQGKIQGSGIQAGDYFVVRNSVIGAGITSIDLHVDSIVGEGKSFVDNVYKAHSVVAIGGTDAVRVSSNVLSIADVTVGDLDANDAFYGTFSWGKINIGSRNGKSFVYQSDDPLSGLSTSAHVSRRLQLKAEY